MLFSKREREEMREFLQGLSCDRFLLIYKYQVYKIITKTLIFIFVSINIYIPYIFDPLGPHISLVNNSVDLIILNW